MAPAHWDARRPHRSPRNGASRDEMLRRRVLPLAEYAAEVARGSGQAAKPTAAERLRLYGTTIAPIPVPLAPGESEAAFEAAFERWLAQRHISRDELMAPTNTNRERTTRCSYAVNLARAFLAKQTATHATGTLSTQLLVHQRTQKDEEEELEEGEEVEDRAEREQPEPLDLSLLPRNVLNATKVTTLAEYRAECKSGAFALLGFMSAAEKQRRFGAPIVPIAVPLAPGETVKQYEERFLTWLVREKHVTLGALQCHPVPMLERYMRLEFASLNGKGLQRFVAPHTPPVKRSVGGPTSAFPTIQAPTKKPKTEKMALENETTKELKKELKDRDQDSVKEERASTQTLKTTTPSIKCVGLSSVAACVEGQCDKCLVSGMKILSERISACETAPSCSCRRPLMDLTLERSPQRPREDDDKDAISTQLQQAYDEINEGILLNLEALESEEARLASSCDTMSIQERLNLQQENEEVRALLEGEFARRTAAAVLLITFLWRNKTAWLRQMVDEPTTSDLPHVQRRIHERMAELAKCDVGEKRGEKLLRPENEEKRLSRLRRQQLALLVGFDPSVRQGVRSVLEAAAKASSAESHGLYKHPEPASANERQ